jgi:hypothetical protein
MGKAQPLRQRLPLAPDRRACTSLAAFYMRTHSIWARLNRYASGCPLRRIAGHAPVLRQSCAILAPFVFHTCAKSPGMRQKESHTDSPCARFPRAPWRSSSFSVLRVGACEFSSELNLLRSNTFSFLMSDVMSLQQLLSLSEPVSLVCSLVY